MGFFAATSRRSTVPYAIEACHLSLWILPRPWHKAWGHSFFFDVGLRIRPRGDLRRLRVAVPFDCKAGDLHDLSVAVLDTEFAPLIFGRPVSVVGDRVSYDGTGLGAERIEDRVVTVSESGSSPEPETANDVGFSTWTIELADHARAGEATYLRFRLPIRKPLRIWNSKGWGFAKRGAIADLRVSDIRESLLLGEGRTEAQHIIPIEKLFVFVIAPIQFVPKHVSPPLHYSRLLEPKVWRNYLRSCGSYRSTKFSIHQWRSPAGLDQGQAKPVSVDAPFRAYADFAHEFGPELFIYYVLGGLFAPVLFWVSREWAFPVLRWMWSLVTS